MNITIVDDEKEYALKLKQTVSDMCTESNITNTITIAKKPEDLFVNDTYRYCDVILLDIHMPEISGIQIASRINDKKTDAEKPYIVFVTKRDDLVFDALKVFPYTFIRKSTIEDLMPCLIRINERISNNQIYVIKDGRKTIRVFLKEIIYLEKKKNYVIIHTQSGIYKERSNMSAKIKELSDYGFIRSHIGYIVNLDYIEEILLDAVKLVTGDTIPLSQRYRKEFNNRYYNWFHKEGCQYF